MGKQLNKKYFVYLYSKYKLNRNCVKLLITIINEKFYQF